jgi:ubiquinone/menaquinone biosynthesis C-methylase UbiE
MFPSRFQFERTRAIRWAVYRMARLSLRSRVLDAGAGEGRVAEEMAARTGRRVFALDLARAAEAPAGVSFVRGDVCVLPFADGAFDAVAFHFVLLWLMDPVSALRETRRVLRPDGVVMVLSEPDLTRREDQPDTGLGAELEKLVARSGGHPDAGARIGAWLSSAGFRPRLQETRAEWASVEDPREMDWEIAFLQKAGALSPEGAAELRARERAAPARRVRIPLTYGLADRE